MDLEGSREGSPVRRMGSEICGERNSSLVFTRREPRSNVSGREMGSTGSFVAASGGREWGGRPDCPGDEDLEARQRLCCPYHRLLLLSDSFSSVLREGVPRGTRSGDTPPALFFNENWDSWSGGQDGGMSMVRKCH